MEFIVYITVWGHYVFFFKNLIILFSKDTLNWSKVTWLLQKNYIPDATNTFYSSKNPKKKEMIVSTIILAKLYSTLIIIRNASWATD